MKYIAISLLGLIAFTAVVVGAGALIEYALKVQCENSPESKNCPVEDQHGAHN